MEFVLFCVRFYTRFLAGFKNLPAGIGWMGRMGRGPSPDRRLREIADGWRKEVISVVAQPSARVSEVRLNNAIAVCDSVRRG